MASKCPVCKQKTVETYDLLDRLDGQKCPDNHYEFSDNKGVEGGFFIRVGNRTMNNLYSRSVRQCRLQNVIISNWVKRERKRMKRRGKR